MKVLIACEVSQVVCKAFRQMGNEAYSCDITSMYGDKPECTQAIQPYQFGDPYTKRTCLWFKGLPKLHRGAAIRSKTFEGIAEAMGKQWGAF